MRVAIIAIAALLVLGGATLFASENEKPPPKKPAKPTVVNDKRFHAALKAAAAGYKGYGRVDDEMRWAPRLCRRPPNPSGVRFSASADAATHGGRKLYWLFARDRGDYVGHDEKKPVAKGQVIVKESWLPEVVKARPKARGIHEQATAPDKDGKPVAIESYIDPYAKKDGKTYKAKSLHGLFVMLKLDPKTDGTDKGWVYGTLTADGKTVTSSGKVASCMQCHVRGSRERLFGLTQD